MPFETECEVSDALEPDAAKLKYKLDVPLLSIPMMSGECVPETRLKGHGNRWGCK